MKEKGYKKNIETLISYLKNQASFSATTLYDNEMELLNDIKRYSKEYGNEENKIYLDILTKVAEDYVPGRAAIFAFDKGAGRHRPAYVDLLERVITAYKRDGKEEAIKIAYNSLDSRTKFTNALERFNANYANAVLYKAMFDEVSKGVEEKLNNRAVISRNTYLDNKALCSTYDDLYHRVYNSGLSLLDYAHQNYIDSFKINNYFRPDLGGCEEKMATEIMSRKDTCMDILIDVINKINNEEIDVFGYYELTKLNPLHLKTIAKDNNLGAPALSKFITKHANPHDEESKVLKEMDAKLVINSEEISYDLKLQAKNALDNLGMPQTVSYYNQMLRKLIKSR